MKDGGPYQKELHEIEKILETRALLFHGWYTFTRIVWPLLGVSFWQIAFRDRNDNEKLDQELYDLIEDPLRIISIAMIPIGLILNILGWYSSRFANLISIYEIVQAINMMLLPFSYGDFRFLALQQQMTLALVLYGTRVRRDVILSWTAG